MTTPASPAVPASARPAYRRPNAVDVPQPPLRPAYGTLHGDRHQPLPADDPRVRNGTHAVHLRARMAVLARETWALQREYNAIDFNCK